MIFGRIKGGLGNQMFIYAFCRMLQKKYGQKAELDISASDHGDFALDNFYVNCDEVTFIDDKDYFKKKYPLRFFIMRAYVSILMRVEKNISVKSKAFIEAHMQRLINYFGYYIAIDGYVPMRFNSPAKNIVVDGYFQSERYFRDAGDLIRKEFKVAAPVEEINKPLLQEIINTNSVCVHIRRGDYFSVEQFKNHAVCTIEYYQAAFEKMKTLTPDGTFFVFSDDIAWVKDNVPFSSPVCYIENKNPAYEELRLMYSCKHFIISNSSFSWWAQYLSDNEDKIVIAPDRWYMNDIRADVYMDNWLVIPVS